MIGRLTFLISKWIDKDIWGVERRIFLCVALPGVELSPTFHFDTGALLEAVVVCIWHEQETFPDHFDFFDEIGVENVFIKKNGFLRL